MDEISGVTLDPIKDKTVRRMGLAALVGFGGFLLWASFAPLAEGVVAAGTLMVEDRRKVVQHLEGGIINALHVREGDKVEAGAVLLELDGLQASAIRDEAAQEVAAHRAAAARLVALVDGGEPEFSVLDDLPIEGQFRSDLERRERALYEQVLEAHRASGAVLQAQRVKTLAGQKEREIEAKALSRAISAAQANLDRRQALRENRLETATAVDAAQQDLSNAQAKLARIRAISQEAVAAAGEIDGQISKLNADFLAAIRDDAVETRRLAASSEERLDQAKDILKRLVIRAPQSGTVLNLAFVTVGGVVSPGEPILEIVPQDQELVAELELRPVDRDAVVEGQSVRVRITAYKSWSMPAIEGHVKSVSADLKYTRDGQGSFYATTVTLNASLDDESAMDFMPGMPVEAFVDAGTKRTFLDYVLEPITGTIRRGSQG